MQVPPRPRVPVTGESDWDEQTKAVLDGLGRLNIFAVLANHPDLLDSWLVFGKHILAGSSLPARERELIILRTGWLCRSEYEFGQHRLLGARAGLTEDEIVRVTAAEVDDGWSARERTLLLATDQLVAEHRLDDALWARLSADWSLQQTMDVVFAVGQYALVSSALNTFRVPLDEGLQGFPA
ncbi:MAG TPA: carboxymuconolactone decarboxylase family protein [Mycobacterium sp.]